MDHEHNESLKNKTAKNFLLAGVSNGLQQLIGAIFGIYLARILTPSDYGLIAMITIFSVIASAFQESGFVNGLANKKNINNKDYNAVFWTSLLISTTIYSILFICAPYIAIFYETPELTKIARVSFLSFWFASFGIAHNAYLFRNLKVRERAITNLASLIISNTIGIIAVYMGLAYWGLVIQTIIYTIVTSSLYWRFSSFRPSFNFDFKPIKDIFGFSSKIFISNVFIHINNQVFAVILGRFYNKEAVGIVNQASKWSLMSQNVITTAVGNITQPLLNQLREDKKRQLAAFKKILGLTAFITFPALFGLSLVSDEFILILLKAEWINSAKYLKILCIGGAFLTVSTVFSNFILSQGKSNLYMWSIISFGLLQIIILILSKPYGIEVMIILATILQTLWIFVWYKLLKPFINFTYKSLISDVFIYAFLACLACVISYIMTYYMSNIYLILFSRITLVLIFYTILNRILHPTILMELIDQAKKIVKRKND